MTIVALIALVLAVEAVTEIIVASEIFAKFRERTFQFNQSLGKLVSCGYCLSVWVSAFFVGFMAIPEWTRFQAISGLMLVFAIHRLSNIWHELISRWLNRAPIALAIHKTETIVMENGNNGDQKG